MFNNIAIMLLRIDCFLFLATCCLQDQSNHNNAEHPFLVYGGPGAHGGLNSIVTALHCKKKYKL